MAIDRNRLLKQSQSFENPLFRSWIERRKRAQVEVVGGQIPGRSVSRTDYLRSLQCWFDHARNARSHFILKLEDVFE